MKKFLLSLSLVAAMTAVAESSFTVNYDWAKVATCTGGTTTSFQPLQFSDGSFIGVYTTTKDAGFAFNGEPFKVEIEGATMSPVSTIITRIDANGKLLWTMNTLYGGINYNSGALAVLPGSDIAMIAFNSRYNAAASTDPAVLKIKDGKGEIKSVDMQCPDYVNPYVPIIMTFKPSDGSIISLQKVECEYPAISAKAYQNTPLDVQGIAATADAFYLTGTAYAKATFPGGIEFTPSNIADENFPGAALGVGYTVKFDSTGKAVKLVAGEAPTDTYCKNQLIGIDGNLVYVVGQTPTSVVGYIYDINLNKAATLNYPMTLNTFEPKATTCLLKKMDITPASIYISGHLVGGFEGTDIVSPNTDKLQRGFVARIDRKTGKIAGGAVEAAGISGYYGAYEIGDNLYTVGYNMNQKVCFIQPYSSTWAAADRIELFTSTGSPTIWPTSYDAATSTLVVPGRSNNVCKYGDTVIAEGFTQFSGFYATYAMGEKSTGAGVDNVTVTKEIVVKGGNSCIVIEAVAPATVNVYNVAGQLVKSASVAAGNTEVAVAPGLYIVAGNKVIVK